MQDSFDFDNSTRLIESFFADGQKGNEYGSTRFPDRRNNFKGKPGNQIANLNSQANDMGS